MFIALSGFIDQTRNEGLVLFAPLDVYFDDGNIFQPDRLYISAENKGIIQAPY